METLGRRTVAFALSPSPVIAANRVLHGSSSPTNSRRQPQDQQRQHLAPPAHAPHGQQHQHDEAAAAGGGMMTSFRLADAPTLETVDLPQLPDKASMTPEERTATAAVCIVRAMANLAPAASPPSQWFLFMLLHNAYYSRILSLIVLLHISLAYLEAPPSLYGHSDEVLIEAGYWPKTKTIPIDVIVCALYVLHCALLFRVERWKGIKNSSKLVLFVVVALLVLDMIVGAVFDNVRPFRCLRPLVYTFSSSQQTMMLKCCISTIASVAKIFALMLTGIVFYAVVGLNIFFGKASSNFTNLNLSNHTISQSGSNILGAACLEQAGGAHPFGTFYTAFVSMYVLATTENFPSVMWPFYTCACEVQGYTQNSSQIGTPPTATNMLWTTSHYCSYRHWIALLFFGSYLVVVFFCLGNSVLGVCYYWYEKVMRENVLVAALQQRFSLIAAFYYLEDGGSVSPEAFLDCVRFLRHVSPGIPGNVDGDLLFFRYLDRGNSGSLTLSEFFKVGELMRASVLVHKGKFRFSWYEQWKKSGMRHHVVRILERNVGKLSLVELVIQAVIVVNIVLASLSSTQGRTERIYAHVTTTILVLEFLTKIFAYGFKAYISDFWSKMECAIMLCSVLSLVLDFSITSQMVNAPVFVLRFFRVFRFLSFFNSFGRATAENVVEGNVDSGESSFISKLLESFATAVPVSGNMLLLVFVYMFFFAMVTMEILATSGANSRQAGANQNTINFSVHKSERDWADASRAITSVAIIIVGNGWSDIMYQAEQSKHHEWLYAWFIILHMFGVFLLLNIIQSLFVYTFSTFLNPKEFQKTVEYQIQRQLAKLHQVSAASFKKVYRTPRLEFLLLSWDDLDREYHTWLDSHCDHDVPMLTFGTSCLPIKADSEFFMNEVTGPASSKARESGRFLSVARSQQIEEFLREQIGATKEAAPSKLRRRSTLADEAPLAASLHAAQQLPMRRSPSVESNARRPGTARSNRSASKGNGLHRANNTTTVTPNESHHNSIASNFSFGGLFNRPSVDYGEGTGNTDTINTPTAAASAAASMMMMMMTPLPSRPDVISEDPTNTLLDETDDATNSLGRTDSIACMASTVVAPDEPRRPSLLLPGYAGSASGSLSSTSGMGLVTAVLTTDTEAELSPEILRIPDSSNLPEPPLQDDMLGGEGMLERTTTGGQVSECASGSEFAYS